ncbi:glutaredoxin-like protein NrdH [Pseudogemmobacter faecipullorum]|uniref:Glutaredoxin-like protein NrdH n=1 Tax=Pseudogemmobacter faecipullorum TaxID=2755041 RepID=A0ABS8CQK6_9RHOB|nr:glutaredoxin-like protein NrdH [Pseudogemmobacter faecipullorum]MCB5411681.1 glutaredoxin-like protein NrdH [Pseudogemmobacter faecipullorum]
MAVTLYTKPDCVQCVATKRALDAKKIQYDTVDLTQDEEAMAKVQALGYRQAPVVIADDDHWAGFMPNKINDLVADQAQ